MELIHHTVEGCKTLLVEQLKLVELGSIVICFLQDLVCGLFAMLLIEHLSNVLIGAFRLLDQYLGQAIFLLALRLTLSLKRVSLSQFLLNLRLHESIQSRYLHIRNSTEATQLICKLLRPNTARNASKYDSTIRVCLLVGILQRLDLQLLLQDPLLEEAAPHPRHPSR